MKGQMSLADFMSGITRKEEKEGLGEPCEFCDIEWCSIICFQRRGYIWDRVNRFAKDENGNYLRKTKEMRECERD